MVRDDLVEAVDAARVAAVRFEIPDNATLRPRQPVGSVEFAAALLEGHGIPGAVGDARVFRPLAADCTVIEAHITEAGDLT